LNDPAAETVKMAPAESGNPLPKITLVTPSFRQGRYLEDCIRSVVDQVYPGLEYIVNDGGSDDGSVDIIRKYAGRITRWRSRPDGGHMAAVQEGFDGSGGGIMGWLNSDDMLAPWALRTVAAVFGQFPEVEWITTMYPLLMDEDGMMVAERKVEGFNARAFYRGRNAPFNPWFYTSMIQQESTFWRRSLWEKAGSRVDTSLRVAGDFELWSRFFEHADLYALGIPLGIFRFQRESFSATEFGAYMEVCRRVLAKFRRRPPSRMELLARRIVRELPDRMQPLSGLAYPVSQIVGGGKGEGAFLIRRSWIV
jgi:glycosyltransferase involved in cell wall biosynthesis